MDRNAWLPAALLGVSLVSACGSRISPLEDGPAAFWPERTITYLPGAEVGVVNAIMHAPSPVVVGRAYAPGREKVARIKVDAAHRQLWILDAHSIYVHDLETLRLKARVVLPPVGDGPSLAPADIALDGCGGAYLISGQHPTVFRVDGTSFEVSRPDNFLTLPTKRCNLLTSQLFARAKSNASTPCVPRPALVTPKGGASQRVDRRRARSVCRKGLRRHPSR